MEKWRPLSSEPETHSPRLLLSLILTLVLLMPRGQEELTLPYLQVLECVHVHTHTPTNTHTHERRQFPGLKQSLCWDSAERLWQR